MNYETVMFQYYTDNIKRSRVAGWVTIGQFMRSIKTPKPKFIELFNKIAVCEQQNNMLEKAKLKANLYHFTPCVHIKNKRQYKDITAFTGLLVLDFDHISNSSDFKEFLFYEYDCIICCYVSPSKKGVKAIVKIPECTTTDEFKSYYFGIGEELQQYNGFDDTGQNSVLPLFQSWDENILIRENPSTWITKGFYPSSLANSPVFSPDPVESSEFHESVIIKIINTGIDRITSNGHPQLRSLSIAVGGYVANNYISRYKALQQLSYKIASNSYLKKGVSGYIKTAEWGIDTGMHKPLRLNFE